MVVRYDSGSRYQSIFVNDNSQRLIAMIVDIDSSQYLSVSNCQWCIAMIMDLDSRKYMSVIILSGG